MKLENREFWYVLGLTKASTEHIIRSGKICKWNFDEMMECMLNANIHYETMRHIQTYRDLIKKNIKKYK